MFIIKGQGGHNRKHSLLKPCCVDTDWWLQSTGQQWPMLLPNKLLAHVGPKPGKTVAPTSAIRVGGDSQWDAHL